MMVEEQAGATLSGLLRAARRTLDAAGYEEAADEARILFEAITGTGRTDLIMDPGRAVDPTIVKTFAAAIRRRLAGEPVYRILGKREFHGLELALSPATLEPRADTETLVDATLAQLRQMPAGPDGYRILDLGTGTGAIVLALLAELPGASATAVDVDALAVATARANAARHGLDGRLTALVSDWFSAVHGQFDAVVSNPPYIRDGEIAGLDPEVRLHDPHLALAGGPDGLDAYRRIAADAAAFLRPDGFVAVEIGHDQLNDVTNVFEAAGFHRLVAAQDLGGRDRALIFRPNRAEGKPS